MAARPAAYGHRKLFARSEELHRLLLLPTTLLGLLCLLRLLRLTFAFCHDMPLGQCLVALSRTGFSFRSLPALGNRFSHRARF